jgi:hypothetical protein
MNKQTKLFIFAAVILGIGGLWFALLTARAMNSTPYPLPAKPAANPAPAPAPVALPSPLTNSPAAKIEVAPPETPSTGSPVTLDERRLFALGMIETGNDDREIGGAGEVSRYQIMPAVWQQYSDSRSYQNPATSQAVARRLWSALYNRFKQQAHREPTDFDMYVLWNTRYGYYASRGFNPARLGPAVRERAQRFVNLVERAGFESADAKN